MAKKMSFADKSAKKAQTRTCPVCQETIQFVKHVKAVKGDKGAWKFRSLNIGICKCNSAEVYG